MWCRSEQNLILTWTMDMLYIGLEIDDIRCLMFSFFQFYKKKKQFSVSWNVFSCWLFSSFDGFGGKMKMTAINDFVLATHFLQQAKVEDSSHCLSPACLDLPGGGGRLVEQQATVRCGVFFSCFLMTRMVKDLGPREPIIDLRRWALCVIFTILVSFLRDNALFASKAKINSFTLHSGYPLGALRSKICQKTLILVFEVIMQPPKTHFLTFTRETKIMKITYSARYAMLTRLLSTSIFKTKRRNYLFEISRQLFES